MVYTFIQNLEYCHKHFYFFSVLSMSGLDKLDAFTRVWVTMMAFLANYISLLWITFYLSSLKMSFFVNIQFVYYYIYKFIHKNNIFVSSQHRELHENKVLKNRRWNIYPASKSVTCVSTDVMSASTFVFQRSVHRCSAGAGGRAWETGVRVGQVWVPLSRKRMEPLHAAGLQFCFKQVRVRG